MGKKMCIGISIGPTLNLQNEKSLVKYKSTNAEYSGASLSRSSQLCQYYVDTSAEHRVLTH